MLSAHTCRQIRQRVWPSPRRKRDVAVSLLRLLLQWHHIGQQSLMVNRFKMQQHGPTWE
jgi:hypothetical protein